MCVCVCDDNNNNHNNNNNNNNMLYTVADPVFNKKRDNYAYAKKLDKSDYDKDHQLKNANDGDIFIYQKSMTCVYVGQEQSGVWLRMNIGYMFIESVVVILHPDCCGTYISFYNLFVLFFG